MIDCSDDAIARLPASYYERLEGTWREYVPFTGSGDSLDSRNNVYMPLFLILPILFGAIHIAAWNNTLPSQLELWMWRSSSVLCSGIFLVFATICFMIRHFFWKRAEYLNDLLINFAFIIYIIVRIYIIFEVFFSMRTLPYSAYDTVNWSAYVPHI